MPAERRPYTCPVSTSLLISGAIIGQDPCDILIRQGNIEQIAPHIPCPANAETIDAHGLAAFPTFANMHGHAPMSLLRGLGGDRPLHIWLNDYVWPAEQRLTDESVYWGTRLACLEMIKSGTTAFNDMYFHLPAMARAAGEMGLRATLGINVFGNGGELTDALIGSHLEAFEPYQGRIRLSIAPHSIYTVSPKGLRHAAQLAQRHGLPYHIHMSETIKEVDDCRQQHNCRPYELLESLGVLELTQGMFIGAHSLHLSPEEIAIMASRHCTAVHNPCSNLKLGSGHFFPYTELRDAGVRVTLGTDGCASSNGLDMLEAARFMSYLQKGIRQDPTVLPVDELQQVCSRQGFEALGWNAGILQPGALADLMLVRLDVPAMVPNARLLDNLFYAAHGDAVDTVICNGQVLMRHRHVNGEEEILRQANAVAEKLTGRGNPAQR